LELRFQVFSTIKLIFKRRRGMEGGGLGSVSYECMRCGTSVTIEELSALPEIKCICGFRVFRKGRQPVVKQIKAI
jgi:DNA-directed RNA polymerase subunit P